MQLKGGNAFSLPSPKKLIYSIPQIEAAFAES